MAYNSLWNIVILEDTLSSSTVRGWISAAGIPSCLGFTYDNTFKDAWTISTAYGARTPVAITPWTILVSSNRDPRFNWLNYGGFSSPNTRNCTIEYDPTDLSDTPAELGTRMWHEICHTMGLPADNMNTTESSDFLEYLQARGSPYTDFLSDPSKYIVQGLQHTQLLIAYYTFLMHKYLGCECYGDGCAPVVNPPYIPPVVEPPVVYENTATDSSNPWAFLAIGVGLLLLLS